MFRLMILSSIVLQIWQHIAYFLRVASTLECIDLINYSLRT